MSRKFVALLIVFGLMSCRDSTSPQAQPDFSGKISLTTDQGHYLGTGEVVVTTTNNSSHDIYDHHCGGMMEGLELHGYWNGSYGSGRGCREGDDFSRFRIRIPPGTTHVDSFKINSMGYSGSWRVQLNLLDEAGRLLPEVIRTSNVFTIENSWRP